MNIKIFDNYYGTLKRNVDLDLKVKDILFISIGLEQNNFQNIKFKLSKIFLITDSKAELLKKIA